MSILLHKKIIGYRIVIQKIYNLMAYHEKKWWNTSFKMLKQWCFERLFYFLNRCVTSFHPKDDFLKDFFADVRCTSVEKISKRKELHSNINNIFHDNGCLWCSHYHITDKHRWKDGKTWKKCFHSKLTKKERSRKTFL